MTKPSILSGTLGHFIIREELPSLGNAEVYRGWDTRLRRDVAFKVIRIDPANDEGAWGLLVREARIASRLNHPNICKVYDVGEENGYAYIIMEYIEGLTLTALIPQRGLPIYKVLRFALQISEGLAHAHAHEVIHRDVKSNNVMITPDGRAKIIDFGSGRRIKLKDARTISSSGLSLEIKGLIVGTLPYVEPAVLHGEAATVQSDLWSLGVLLYEMLTGKLPFAGRTYFETSYLIMSSSPAPLHRSIPAGLLGIVNHCLEKDRRRRYERADEIVYDLRRLWNSANSRWSQRVQLGPGA